jgi:hypothetical protein
MDFPEQSVPNDKIARAIDRNQNIRIGFGTCALCAKEARSSRHACLECERVDYCSNNCQGKDKYAAGSHTELVCSILRDCSADDEIDMLEAKGGRVDSDEAADRVRSERESYPATVANALTAFECFDPVLQSASGGSLTVHLVGASEAELWTQGEPPAYQSYEDALGELVGPYKIKSLNLVFVGPECPPVPFAASAGTVNLQSFREAYDQRFLDREGPPDIVVWFNPGFTCPDYTWEAALRYEHCIVFSQIANFNSCCYILCPSLHPIASPHLLAV